MAGVNVKISADVSSFKKNIQEATGAVKSLDAQLETNEKQLKLNGDAELYMSNKAGLLKAQLEAQRTVVSNTAQALQQMKAAGVDPSSRAFQTMETNLAKAQGKLIDIQTELKNVKSGSKGAETGAKDMNTELKNIGKGVAFQNVTSGLKEITSSLASAGRAAVNFGKRLARSAMDSTEWADDVLTRAMQYSVDAETIQKMDNVAAYIDTDVDTIITAKGRLAKNSGKLSELFGLETDGMSLEDMFWGAGEAIMAMTDEVEQEQAAQEIFGRGWKELIPLFTAGQDEYNRLMEEQNVLSNEQVEKLGEADDKFKQMQQEVDKLKNEFWAENSDKIIGLLQWLIDNKDAVVGALTAIGIAFAAIKIGEFASNLAKAVNGFKNLLGFGNGAAGGGGGAPVVPPGGGGGFLSGVGDKVAAAAGSTFGTAAIGGAIAVGMWMGIGALAKSFNQQSNIEYNAGRYNDEENAKVLQSAVRGLMNSNDANAGWQMRWFASHYGAGDFFDLFNYTDANRGNANYLLDILGQTDASNVQAMAAFYDMWQRVYGDIDYTARGNDIYRGMNAEQQQALRNAQEALAQVNQAGGTLDYTWLLTGMKDYFSHMGQTDENGEWTIPSLMVEKIEPPADAAEQVAAQVGTVTLPAQLALSGMDMGSFLSMVGSHANGLPYVPYDGYLSVLHRGERVMTASENRHYTYNSNNYFGNVNLNNGQDIEALCDSIDRHNRRQRSGYGVN